MPCRLNPSVSTPLDLAEVVARLEEQPVDFDNPAMVDHGAALLAGLALNRDFLGDMVLSELKASFTSQLNSNRYSAQVFLLHRSDRRFYLRANMWPAANDHITRVTGTAPFAYDMPHDHNFSFLTVGYLGPGYISDYYEYDADQVAGAMGEAMHLRFVERAALAEQQVQLYRAHRDIYRQLPPETLSVSLNIMAEGEHVPWRDQYNVDLDHGTIAGRSAGTAMEMMLRCAAHLGDNGCDLADDFARHHPVPRIRSNALAALAASMADPVQRITVLERGLADPDRRVQADCAGRCALLAAGDADSADAAHPSIPAQPALSEPS